MKSILFAILSLMIAASSASAASTFQPTSISITSCGANNSNNSLFIKYNDGWNALMPLKTVSVEQDSQGNILFKDAATSAVVSLGQPIRSWEQPAGCNNYYLEMNQSTPSSIVLGVDEDLMSTPCVDVNGVFPMPALCKNKQVSLNLSEGSQEIQMSCTDRIQTTSGNGHKGARVGGDCRGY